MTAYTVHECNPQRMSRGSNQQKDPQLASLRLHTGRQPHPCKEYGSPLASKANHIPSRRPQRLLPSTLPALPKASKWKKVPEVGLEISAA